MCLAVQSCPCSVARTGLGFVFGRVTGLQSGWQPFFSVRAKGGSQLARPYSSLDGLRSLPVARAPHTPTGPSPGLPNQHGALHGAPTHSPCTEQTLDIVTGPQGTVSSLFPSLSSLIPLSLSLLPLCFLTLPSVLRCHHPVPVHS